MKAANIIWLILFLATEHVVSAQSFRSDFDLLEKSEKKTAATTPVKKTRHWNPLANGYLLGVTFYQRVISEQMATNCAFELTCSRFSKQMVSEFGIVKGYFLTFDRLSRCTRISPLETYPIRLSATGKILETPADFHFH